MLQITRYEDGAEVALTPEGEGYGRVLVEIEQDFARLVLSANKTADAQRIKELGIELSYGGLSKFVAQMAVYVGTVPCIMGAAYNLISAMANRGSLFLESAVKKLCKNPDDVSGTLAVYDDSYGMPIPTRLKKALLDIFETFSEAELLEHNHKGRIPLAKVVLYLYPRRSPLLDLLADKKGADKNWLRKVDFWVAGKLSEEVTPALVREISQIELITNN